MADIHQDRVSSGEHTSTSTGGPRDADEFAAECARTTLEGFQHIWRSHAAAMDTQGRSFAQTIFHLHSQALQEAAEAKTFEPKQVTAVLNSFTSAVREEVLKLFQVMRQADDGFAQGLYQLSRQSFSRNLRDALDAKDAACADKIRRLKADHEQALAQQRQAASVALQQETALIKQTLSKDMRDSNRKTLSEVVRTLKDQLQRHYDAHVADLKKQYANLPVAPLYTKPMTPPAGAGAGGGDGGSGSLPGSPVRPLRVLPPPPLELPEGLQDIFAVPAAGVVSEDAGAAAGAPGLDSGALEFLQALARQDDDSGIGALMARKDMEAALKSANQQADELRSQVEEITLQMQREKSEVETWRDKWTLESTKTDGIKRECLQIILKCEKRVKALQAEHSEEMSKRDVLLRRCKDTILRLETELAGLTGVPADPRLVPYETPRGGSQTTIPATTTSPQPPQPTLQLPTHRNGQAPGTSQPGLTSQVKDGPHAGGGFDGLHVEATLGDLNLSLNDTQHGGESGGLSPLPPPPAAPGGTQSVPASPAVLCMPRTLTPDSDA